MPRAIYEMLAEEMGTSMLQDMVSRHVRRLAGEAIHRPQAEVVCERMRIVCRLAPFVVALACVMQWHAYPKAIRQWRADLPIWLQRRRG